MEAIPSPPAAQLRVQPAKAHTLLLQSQPRLVTIESWVVVNARLRGRETRQVVAGRLTFLAPVQAMGKPPRFHAGGLRYHGMAPLISRAKELGLLEAMAYAQGECFAAGAQFARAEGIVPTPEANHAIKGAIEEALRCKREARPKPSCST